MEESADPAVVLREHEPLTQTIRRNTLVSGGATNLHVEGQEGGCSTLLNRNSNIPSILVNSLQETAILGGRVFGEQNIGQGAGLMARLGSSAVDPSRGQHFGMANGRIPNAGTLASGVPRGQPFGESSSRMLTLPIQPIHQSGGDVSSPGPLHDEGPFMDAIEMSEFDSQDEDDEFVPAPDIPHPALAPQTPTHSTSGPTRGQKGKAPLRTANTAPLGVPRGRPPVSVNEEVERVGHRIQAELVDVAETLGLSYRTLLRKIGFGTQQEVCMPNLANVFRKVNKHRLLANNERKYFHCPQTCRD